jgi:hypothetical protein
MGLQIEDGMGSGKTVGVDSQNRMKVYANIEDEASYYSTLGKCFHWTHSYSSDSADTILWVRNDSSSELLHIVRVHISGNTATAFQIHFPDNTASPAGTAVTGINADRTSSTSADATAYGDETSNTQSNVVINGYRGAETFTFMNNGQYILGKNDIIAVDCTTAGTVTSVTIVGYFK